MAVPAPLPPPPDSDMFFSSRSLLSSIRHVTRASGVSEGQLRLSLLLSLLLGATLYIEWPDAVKLFARLVFTAVMTYGGVAWVWPRLSASRVLVGALAIASVFALLDNAGRHAVAVVSTAVGGLALFIVAGPALARVLWFHPWATRCRRRVVRPLATRRG
jgi:hypothetical protein